MKRLLEYSRLTRYIERAMNTQDALKEGYALYVEDNEDEFLFFLYDTKKLTRESLESVNGNLEEWIMQSLVGISEMSGYSRSMPFKSYAVAFTGALKGWGVLLYDIMLTQAGKKGLCADRGSVSPMAKNVWEFYLTKRASEITSKPIDDEDDPITSPVNDDGYVHSPFKHGETDISKRASYDRVYYLNPSSYVNTSGLEINHLNFLENLKSIKVNKSKFLNVFNERNLIVFFAYFENLRKTI